MFKSFFKTWTRLIRSEQPSAQAAVVDSFPKLVPSLQRRCAPRTTAVSMARNEGARAHDAMRHFCALFDRVVVIDHLSEDDTAKIVSGYDGAADTEVVLLRALDRGYYQSEYMTAVANALLHEQLTDWIFFLDFDEFLPFDTVAAFHQALVDYSEEPVIHMNWLNLAMKSTGTSSLNSSSFLIGHTVSPFVKIAINANRLSSGKILIEQGNHAAVLPGETKSTHGRKAFGLFHLPFTSIESLQKKVKQGSKALADTTGKDATLGQHWRILANQIEDLSKDPKLLLEVALQYGRPLDDIFSALARGEHSKHIRDIKMNVAQVSRERPIRILPEIPSFTLDTIGPIISARFRKHEEGQVVKLKPPVYSALSKRPKPKRATRIDGNTIERAVIAAATDVEVLTPTAWSGHIPFLFSVMEILRPRRYVELGTHEGASFFAACQHVRSNNNYGECVAIDIWEGDHQTGFYDESVFQRFKWLCDRHFHQTGKYIRGYFDDAVNCFEDHSIDLLHIDGLHTYEAVRSDFQTWKRKLTSNGAILFHDTNEFQTDFGVWQLFSEIRNQAPVSFEFRHCHGLGIVAFGNERENQLAYFLKHLREKPALFESYYSVLGRALYDAGRFRIDRGKIR